MKDFSLQLKNRIFSEPLSNIFLISVFYACFITGYDVFSSDQTQYLLLPFREIYENFCLNDWFVWETSHYHFVFSYILKFLNFVTLGYIEIGLFITWIFFLIIHLHSLYFLSRTTGGDYKHFILLVLFIISYSSFSLGDSIINSGILLPAFMAIPVTTYAFGYLISGRYRIAFTLLGTAGLIHINFGIVGIMIFVSYYIIVQKFGNLKELFISTGLFSVLILPNIIPVLMNFNENNEWLWLSFFIRSPHHYDPSVFGLFEWLETLIPLSLAIFIYYQRKDTAREIKIIYIILLLSGLVLIMNLFTGILFFYQIYVWRFSPYLLIFSYLIINKFVLSGKYDKRVVWGILMFLLLFLILHRGADIGLKRFVIMTAGVFLFYRMSRKGTVIPLFTGALIVLMLLGNGYKGVHFFKSDEITDWVRNNTPENSYFLTPPDVEGFRILARRAIVVNTKSSPIGVGSEMFEWKQRLEKVTNTKNIEKWEERGYDLWGKLKNAYLQNSPVYVREVMEFYSAGFFMTYTDHQDLELFHENGFTEIFRKESIVIFRYDK
ncbi:DUF6798 domain-containing protein [candidate division KSB1 bacterium]